MPAKMDIADCILHHYDESSMEEFEQTVELLRDALKKEVAKTSCPFYENLTFRQFVDFWEKASEGRKMGGSAYVLEELAYPYDPDSPRGFFNWVNHCIPGSHIVDLLYASSRLFPQCVNSYEMHEGIEQNYKWVLILQGDNPYDMAKCSLRLQQAGIEFMLSNPKDLMKDFNKMVGIRKRQLRYAERLKLCQPIKKNK